MIGARGGATLRQIDQLFGAGTVAGLSDAQLLERFRTRRDEAAFVALVARHGPMVLAVCRGVLRDEHAAEDAFQATFLILVRKAERALGRRVARRLASSGRLPGRGPGPGRCGPPPRAGEEGRGGGRPEGNAESEPDDELRALLHAEIGRLPDRLRLPVVLCDLEGLTRDQAAERLRWTEGTVRGRLARARTLLRQRLTRRGVVLPAGRACRGPGALRHRRRWSPRSCWPPRARAASGQGTATRGRCARRAG